MASSITGAVAIVGGLVLAVVDLLLSVRTTRRRAAGRPPGPTSRWRSPVVGLAGVVFGVGDVAFLLPTTA